jgi:YidC/Oxa1 family membrane protein insertase
MGFFINLLAPPLGYIMRFCYSLVGNIGIAIIIFSIIVRILMFPLSVKQQKTTARTQIFNPQLMAIRKKYAGNQQKMQEEMMKLQRQTGYNPASGCLPMILTMLILMGVLGVVYGPMTYFERIESSQIAIIREVAIEVERDIYLENNDEASEETLKREVDRYYDTLHAELRAIGVYIEHPDRFNERLSPETIEKLESLKSGIFFLGINFSQIPTMTWPIMLIPIFSFLFAAIHMIIMQIIQRKTMPDAMAQMGSMKYMLYFMPILSLVIAFQFPAGAGFYWAISSLVMIGQTLLIHKIYPPEKLKEEIKAKLEARGVNLDKIVVVEKSDGSKVEKKASQMSSKESKEYHRKKLEEARKADLEKYGEVGAASTEDGSPPAEENKDEKEE